MHLHAQSRRAVPVSQDLTDARVTLKDHLDAADRAIRAAMTDADAAVAKAQWRGPERRRGPR